MKSAECVLCIIPSWNPPRTARSSGQPAMRRPGTKSKCQSCLVGFYGGNPGEHGENMQTPHRKAREQAPTCCTMRDLSPQPSCCEATVLRTEQPCLFHMSVTNSRSWLPLGPNKAMGGVLVLPRDLPHQTMAVMSLGTGGV